MNDLRYSIISCIFFLFAVVWRKKLFKKVRYLKNEPTQFLLLFSFIAIGLVITLEFVTITEHASYVLSCVSKVITFYCLLSTFVILLIQETMK